MVKVRIETENKTNDIRVNSITEVKVYIDKLSEVKNVTVLKYDGRTEKLKMDYTPVSDWERKLNKCLKEA